MADSRETIVLVHGLWVRSPVFFLHQRWFHQRGFSVRRFSYPSVSGSLRQNSEALYRFVSTAESAHVHLVGHSLGGLVVLDMLAHHPDLRLRRAVLMGSPCAGCHAASALAGLPLLGAIVGRSLKDWLASLRPALPDSVEIGVLAGDLSLGLGRLIPGLPPPNDGVVSVAETRLPEARDSIVLHVSHTGMLVSRACAEQAAAFLKCGNFIHE